MHTHTPAYTYRRESVSNIRNIGIVGRKSSVDPLLHSIVHTRYDIFSKTIERSKTFHRIV